MAFPAQYGWENISHLPCSQTVRNIPKICYKNSTCRFAEYDPRGHTWFTSSRTSGATVSTTVGPTRYSATHCRVYPKIQVSHAVTHTFPTEFIIELGSFAYMHGAVESSSGSRRQPAHCLILAKWLIPWSFVMHIHGIFKLKKKTFNDGFRFSVLQNESELIKQSAFYGTRCEFCKCEILTSLWPRRFRHTTHEPTTDTGRWCFTMVFLGKWRRPSVWGQRDTNWLEWDAPLVRFISDIVSDERETINHKLASILLWNCLQRSSRLYRTRSVD